MATDLGPGNDSFRRKCLICDPISVLPQHSGRLEWTDISTAGPAVGPAVEVNVSASCVQSIECVLCIVCM